MSNVRILVIGFISGVGEMTNEMGRGVEWRHGGKGGRRTSSERGHRRVGGSNGLWQRSTPRGLTGGGGLGF